MRTLILKMSLTADGFVCGPHGEIDWLFQSSTPSSRAWILTTLCEAGMHLMGSRTYQDMASYWPVSSDPMAAPMNAVPKAVFTRGAAPVSPGSAPATQAVKDAVEADGPGTVKPDPEILKGWQHPTLLRGDLAAHVRTLKEGEGRPLLAHGGASFARSLAATGLIDEYRLVVHPVLLGSGRPIFTGLNAPLPLALVSSTSFDGGVVANVYRPKR